MIVNITPCQYTLLPTYTCIAVTRCWRAPGRPCGKGLRGPLDARRSDRVGENVALLEDVRGLVQGVLGIVPDTGSAGPHEPVGHEAVEIFCGGMFACVL